MILTWGVRVQISNNRRGTRGAGTRHCPAAKVAGYRCKVPCGGSAGIGIPGPTAIPIAALPFAVAESVSLAADRRLGQNISPGAIVLAGRASSQPAPTNQIFYHDVRVGGRTEALVFTRFRRQARAEDQERIERSLEKTRRGVFGRITTLFQANELDEEFWEELEALLIQADVGIETTLELIARLQERVARAGIKRAQDAYELLQEEMAALLSDTPPMALDHPRLLTVILMVGVNGSGKTTSIAKLAYYLQRREKKVLLAAADTFRAAAIEQLQAWAARVGAEVIAHQPGSDPGAVVYDAIRAAQESRQADVVIIDTAGRLHTKYNLMRELEKIRTVCARQVHQAPHETFLVLDATTGQNALMQARKFKESVDISGVILTKLDGTAKGGVVFAIQKKLGVPVRFVGTGETLEDLAEFDAVAFVEGLFA